MIYCSLDMKYFTCVFRRNTVLTKATKKKRKKKKTTPTRLRLFINNQPNTELSTEGLTAALIPPSILNQYLKSRRS